VSGFEKDFGGRVRLKFAENDTPEGRAAATRYGFSSHGIVIFDPAGRLVFLKKDHLVNADEVHRFLVAAVGTPAHALSRVGQPDPVSG